MERIKQNLDEAKAELIKAQDWLRYVRWNNHLGYISDAIKLRHRAADRVTDLQCMAGANI